MFILQTGSLSACWAMAPRLTERLRSAYLSSACALTVLSHRGSSQHGAGSTRRGNQDLEETKHGVLCALVPKLGAVSKSTIKYLKNLDFWSNWFLALKILIDQNCREGVAWGY